MKISFNWLKKYIDITRSPEEIAHLLTHSGLEVEGIETQESIPGGLKKYVIGQVLTCERHPNADKLSKTTVEVGQGTILPIVCGAPNVKAGQKVIVALPGAEVRMEGKEPFVIQKTKIRGEVSEGMICAEDELGIGHSHEGILVLTTDLPTGTLASDYFNITSDAILEIGLTPNRADAASHFGVARELTALLKQPLSFNPSSVSYKGTFKSPVSIDIQNADACPRYAGAYLKGIKVAPSPEWLQQALISIGLHPINNVVDVTNYVLHGLGQPLHAFDADKIAGNKVIVKTMTSTTPFLTLDGKERKLEPADLIIGDTEKPMCIAGVFGGKDSGVSESTKNVFLESAYFHPDYIRKTAQRLGLKTDASFRFERGTNPDMVLPGLKLAVSLLQELTGAEASDFLDLYPTPVPAFEVVLKWHRLAKLIGEELPKERVKEILASLEISLLSETEEGLILSVPPYRVDVQREADVVEEILRIYGFNNIVIQPALRTDFLASFPTRDTDKAKLNLGRLLVAKGFYEVYNNSLTGGAYLQEEEKAVKILNALSSELDVMRQSLLPSALQTVLHNVNRKQKEVNIFEIGYVYFKEEKGFKESQHLSLVISGSKTAESWQQKTQEVSFYDLKNSVADVLGQLGVTNYSSKLSTHVLFGQSVEIVSQNKSIGVFGQISKEVLKKFDIKQEVFAAELDLDAIFSLKQKGISYKELPKFPEVRRDLSLVLDKKVKFEEIEKMSYKLEPVLLKEMNVFDVFEGEVLGKDKKSYSISYTILDENKTLTDNEIEAVMTKFISGYEKDLGAIIRR
jgi:phenylalanyl-tRNA synthetase beta chain